MAPQFDLTRFYDVIIRNSVFQLGFLTREFQIPTHSQTHIQILRFYQSKYKTVILLRNVKNFKKNYHLSRLMMIVVSVSYLETTQGCSH